MIIEKISVYWTSSHVSVLYFLNLKKAFDTVNHHVLLNKLTFFNFSDNSILYNGLNHIYQTDLNV